MKKGFILVIIFIIVVAIFVIFWKCYERQPQGTANVTTNLNGTVPATGIITSTTAKGEKSVETKQFDFRLVLPSGFSFFSGSNVYGYDVFEASISRPNSNTNEEKNRETPNGFNTAFDDSINLFIYKNRDGLTASDIVNFRQWLAVRSLGLSAVSVNQSTIGSYTALKTIEADGIDSSGQYYYFFGHSYIYVFGSDDFTDVQMKDFLSGFSILDL